MSTYSQIKKEFNHEDTNYYDSPKLDYYEPDAFNQSNRPLDVYHVEDLEEYEFRHRGNRFF